MKKKTFITIAKSCLVSFTLLSAVCVTASKILLENESVISNFFGATTSIIYKDEDGGVKNTTYYDTVFKSVAEQKANTEALCQEVVKEGAVLLKNDNNALPLAKGSKVNLYGVTSTQYVVSGGGSGATAATNVDLKESFEDPSVNLDVNDELYAWYKNQNANGFGRKGISGLGCGVGSVTTIGEAPWASLPLEKETNANAGIFFIGRVGCEDVDNFLNINDPELTGNASFNSGDDMTNGNYLTLSPNEIDVLENMKKLKDQGSISKIIVILNTTNQVEADFIDQEKYGIDSALWIASVGSTGIKAVPHLLVGNATPSGRLSDTFWAKHKYNPVNANFGDYTYEGTMVDGKDGNNLAIYDYGTTYRAGYVVYQEGIYNGYRYTETRYEDTILGRENVGSFNYKDVVSYPFGYGLSYTNFEYNNFDVKYNSNEDVYTATLDVTNVGSTYSGKEVVQIYLQKPYTQYDIDTGVEKASVELVGFAKTNILAPGQKESVTVKIDGEQLASYDSYGKKTYILESGDYYFTAAKDSHDAINNILACKNVDRNKIVSIGNCGKGEVELVKKFEKNISGGIDDTTYSMSTEAMEAGRKSEPVQVTNKFDYADINLYEHRGDNHIEYITRNNWEGTVHFGIGENNEVLKNYERITLTPGLESDVKEEKFFEEKYATDDIEYPTMGSKQTNYTLMDLRAYDDNDNDPTNDVKIPFDDPMWEDLLDQLTWEDMVSLLSDGQRKTGALESISKPETIDHNGAVGVNQRYDGGGAVNRGFAVTKNDENKSTHPTAKPSNGIAASTFNIELMERYGEAWGEDALWAGYSGLYGPGINMHRSPYAGRIFEYFSEDPILSGKMDAYLCKGIESKGIYVYNKHGILNEQEEGRRTISTWANEQSIREIYLKPFEIAIEEGGARNIMTGLNKIGPYCTIVSGFCNDLLRDEFGMEGFVVTDFHHDGQAQIMPVAHLYGTDLPDRTYQSRGAYVGLEKNHGRIAWAMREACHNILYTTLHSAMINGLSSDTRILTITPNWVHGLKIGTTATVILAVASLLLLLSAYLFPTVISLSKKAIYSIKTHNGLKGLFDSFKNRSFRKQLNKKESKFLWLGRIIVLVGTAALIMGKSIAPLLEIKNNNDLWYEHIGSKPIDETLFGENIVDNIFEAEDGAISGISSNGGKTNNNHICPVESFIIGTQYSGGVLIDGLTTSTNASEANELSFTFNSDKYVKVLLIVKVQGYAEERPFSTGYNLLVNGEIPKGYQTVQVPASNNALVDVEIPIVLEKGENKIVFQGVSSLMDVAFGIDYINIRTSASLTNFEKYQWDHESFNYEVIPSIDDTGILTIADAHGSKSYVLPSLTDGLNKGFYSYVKGENKVEYYAKYSSESFAIFDNLVPRKLILQGATFEDGTTEKESIAYCPVEKIVVEEEHIGFYEANNKDTDAFEYTSFIMPDRDLTLVSIKDDESKYKYATEIDGTVKQVALNDPNNEYSSFHPKGTEGFDKSRLISSRDKAPIAVFGEGVTATRYNYENVKEGYSFLTMSTCTISGSKKTYMYAAFKNYGSETLNFTMRQINSSSKLDESNPHFDVEVKPNETVYKNLTFTYGNMNMMSYFYFTGDTTTKLSLAVAQFVSYTPFETSDVPSNPNVPDTPDTPDVDPTITNTLSLNGDVTFEDGSKSMTLAHNSSLPTIKYNDSNITDAKYNLGWILDDGTNKKYVLSSDFVMPNKAVTLTPYNTVKFKFADSISADGYLDTWSTNAIDVNPADNNPYHANLINNASNATASFKNPAKIVGDLVGVDLDIDAKANGLFRVMHAYNTRGTKIITYTFKNFGSQTATFTLYQVNSGVNTTNAPYVEVTLEPNEIKTVSVELNYSNKNLMFVMNFASEYKGAIWYSSSITSK